MTVLLYSSGKIFYFLWGLNILEQWVGKIRQEDAEYNSTTTIKQLRKEAIIKGYDRDKVLSLDQLVSSHYT